MAPIQSSWVSAAALVVAAAFAGTEGNNDPEQCRVPTSPSPAPSGTSSATSACPNANPRRIRRLEWIRGETNANQIARVGTPAIVQGDVPSKNWEVLAVWKDLDGFVSSYRGRPEVAIENIYRSPTRNITYFNPSMPLANARRVSWKAPFSHAAMPAKTLVDLIEKRVPGHGNHYYLMGNLQEDPWFEPVQAILPTDESIRNYIVDDKRLAKNPTEFSFNVWLGEANLTAMAHFDSYHNFYIQVSGRKRFVLLPLCSWKQLKLYPYIHPSARQSILGVQAAAADYKVRTDVEKCPFQPEVVDLEPGDVLYIPPYWFHEVSSMENSISVNVWTTSKDEATITTLAGEAVPFVNDFNSLEVDLMVFDMLGRIVNGFENLSGEEGITLIDSMILLQFDAIGFTPNQDLNTPLVRGASCNFLMNKVESSLTQKQKGIVRDHAAYILNGLQNVSSDVLEVSFGIFVQWLAAWSAGGDKTVEYMACVRAFVADAKEVDIVLK